eukprot:SAG31_NODE_7224_length_1750_cov_1.585100_2_plen_39_part_01
MRTKEEERRSKSGSSADSTVYSNVKQPISVGIGTVEATL